MARRRISQDTGPEPARPDDATAESTDDTEGHSAALFLGMMALDEANRAAEREKARRRPAEALPPITKPFPNMRAAAAAQPTAEDAPAAAPALKPATSNS